MRKGDKPSPSSQSRIEPSSLARVVRGRWTCNYGRLLLTCLAYDRRRRSSRRDGLVVLPYCSIRADCSAVP